MADRLIALDWDLEPTSLSLWPMRCEAGGIIMLEVVVNQFSEADMVIVTLEFG